ncbi:homeobox protein Rhox13-like [Mus pahari]|uniref:homeobox protein Rhox13-like n=1 Tax=Mus pahari TaxID=10093 RepID=UPI000A3101B9|nr:homeobox protein Rhox13-like [Mus pahari]
MADRVPFDHNYYIVECKEETNASAQAGAVASTSSTEEAPGAVAVAQPGVVSSHDNQGAVGSATVKENESDSSSSSSSSSSGSDSSSSESGSDSSDESDDSSSSDEDTSDTEEEAAPSVAAAVPPTVPVAAAIQIPGPCRYRPRPRQHRRRRGTPFHFTQWQVKEMESLFEETQYPDVLTRRALARTLNVPEVKVKVWFTNRRAKQRKIERREMLRNIPPANEDFIFITDMEEPS